MGGWWSLAKRVYYFSGLAYYVYHWFFLLGGGGLVGGFIAVSRRADYVACALIPVSLVLLGLGFVFLAKLKTVQHQSHNPQIQEVLTESTYTAIDAKRYGYSKRLIIKALSDGVESYSSKFSWSGGSNVQPSASYPNRGIEIYPESTGTHTVCRYKFERPLRKGEQHEFSYHFDMMVDGNEAPRPFLSHSVRTPTAKMVLRVKLEDNSVHYYKRLIFASTTSDIPLFNVDVAVPPNSLELLFEVVNPRIGYRYCIQW